MVASSARSETTQIAKSPFDTNNHVSGAPSRRKRLSRKAAELVDWTFAFFEKGQILGSHACRSPIPLSAKQRDERAPIQCERSSEISQGEHLILVSRQVQHLNTPYRARGEEADVFQRRNLDANSIPS
jgi:hypothetical protein